ncbi:Alcohol dehydrogenase, zinc-binding domain protein [Magnetococcus marinus MC-1]|uniref:Alcohol dehydrogenase, zinc-binding domain protein n=1 Tax=Magnetococcus marinus (strain ATCC BAA-1437 / JCM 17883 / MC-1) TaxID=156889 RepID=A0L538_MAGMM|nr:MDR family oxidoreductase [Magnetococcus marinus]ABK43081.1 Alcohol dehydrogenase, zinc-binding domain protein [Magnetococcus marinus MC-1]
MSDTFKALVLRQDAQQTLAAIEQLSLDQLPEGEVLVAVEHSSLNYKDGLAITGTGKIVRHFPHVPGIDLAGEVISSESALFKPGDRVVLTGWGVGERHWGGHAQRARVKAKWLNHLPTGFSSARAMAVGTAGLTAMLCMMALQTSGITPHDGPILVTGAAGGVGSIAVALLAAAGYEVHASSGRAALEPYLKELGAHHIIPREQLSRESRPLESEQWAGAIDTVGSQTLATLLSQMRYNGAVAACGLAGGMDLHTTVFPFILRGVRLLGIDSVYAPAPHRQQAWQQLAQQLPMALLDSLTRHIPLEACPEAANQIMAGQIQGRVVVDL